MLKKKLITIIIIITLLLFNIPLIYSATDEGYGEANDNLGQFVDSFENLDNITVIDDLIRNSTLNCIELNTTSILPIYEDFDTNYTENDGLNRLTQSDTQSNWTTLFRGDDRIYLYKDYGVAFFTDWVHEFELYIDTITNQATDTMVSGVLIYDDALNDWLGNRGGNVDQLGIITVVTNNENGYRLQVRFSNNGADTRTNGDYEFSEDTRYYCRFNKTGTKASLLVYSDSSRTIEVESIIHTCGADDSYRYINAPMSLDFGLSVSSSTGFIENLWLGNTTGGYKTDGYFITDDYLNYTTGNSLVLLTNASIPIDTSMTVQFSNDNLTWVDNEGNVGSTTILDGFNAIDLRDLNYTDDYKLVNFTGIQSSTPRLYQLREITTNGTAGNGVSTEEYAGLLIIGLIIGLILGIGVSRS